MIERIVLILVRRRCDGKEKMSCCFLSWITQNKRKNFVFLCFLSSLSAQKKHVFLFTFRSVDLIRENCDSSHSDNSTIEKRWVKRNSLLLDRRKRIGSQLEGKWSRTTFRTVGHRAQDQRQRKQWFTIITFSCKQRHVKQLQARSLGRRSSSPVIM